MDELIFKGFSEVWKWYKANYSITDAAGEYDRLLKEAKELAAAYHGVEIIQDFIIIVLKDLDRRGAAQN